MTFLKYLIYIVFFAGAFQASASTLMRTSFENTPEGTPFTREWWSNDGFQPATWDEGLSTRTIISGDYAANGLQSFRVMYPKNEFGTDNTGCQVPLLFDQRNEAYMSYYLMFSENFSWGTTSYGGKLPGLAGGANCSGGKMCDGTNGWSARFMWRAGGKIVLYLYDMVKTETYGENHQLYYPDGTPVVATPGQWLHIAERVKANSTPTSQDGEIQVWVNGQEVLYLTGRQFTNNGEQVDKLYISTFHGGDDNTWCPTDTCYTYFDDICIGTEYEDVRFPDCRKPNLGADRSLCNTAGAVTLEAENLGNGYDLTWFYNGERVGEGATLKAKAPGTYVVMADSGRCSLRDTVEVSNQLQPNLGADKYICQTSFVQLDCGLKADDGLVFTWVKNGETLDRENGPTLLTKDAGNYTVKVSSDKCAAAESSISVSSGLLPMIDVDAAVGVPVSFMAPRYLSNFLWTDKNGNILGTGQELTYTPKADDDYIFIKDANGFYGVVGKPFLTENAWTRSNFSTEFMNFTVLRDLAIDSISIYPVKPLDATINIINDDTKEVVFSQTYNNLPGGGEQRLPIGALLSAGNYHIDANGTTGSLYHSHTDADIQFPYVIDGLLELTGCNLAWINTKGWYLFFYNWHVSAGNYCAPTPIKLIYTQTGTSNALANNPQVKVSQTSGQLVISGLDKGCRISLFNANGHRVATRKEETSTSIIATSHLTNGIYMLTVKKDNQLIFNSKILINRN